MLTDLKIYLVPLRRFEIIANNQSGTACTRLGSVFRRLSPLVFRLSEIKIIIYRQIFCFWPDSFEIWFFYNRLVSDMWERQHCHLSFLFFFWLWNNTMMRRALATLQVRKWVRSEVELYSGFHTWMKTCNFPSLHVPEMRTNVGLLQ